MLLVPTELRPSPLHGIGLFASAPIARGTAVWRFAPGFDQEFDDAEIDRMEPHIRGFFDTYGYLDRTTKRLILCFDNARFANHSESPNLRPDYTQDAFGIDVALRDISAGEELTLDYDDFEEGGRLWVRRPSSG
jgi:uncharacterized protein